MNRNGPLVELQAASPAATVAPQGAPSRRCYQPPTLTDKKALAEVTLFSSANCTPGTPGCTIGHP